ncbi:lysine N(6)-hydroxylase/L-ornithine N(5)-oxygenase family protein [Chromohalobacter nigrandesensis]|uniref:lysine N(6)-hydroxylase/L-ornithine N(5)-oxygenase family protein n=1 Tax=Chromohalobacter nigrandesensis TaxID=119863 RepID=UPI001FF46BE2|nr:lysine N(6)-hydroxylase/L-ornithine N(5)-oxygenase family protein [Chromohalobacter nigrandesensis]MCK0746450.1 lysine N(6)-hydroxylase/L-ornithine N(5)-oxygenase family protein [Chromohalobacter nigrandesensis]
MPIHDLIGIGFGPSNIALAIALEEQRNDELSAFFIERQPRFAWHPDMLLENAHMQISFLKDLVTPRNPASRYTFLNYLHSKGRLQDFINLQTFFPSRHEFNDYLAWVASHFEERCAYGEEVVEVQPQLQDGDVELLRVCSLDANGKRHERLTRSLVVSVGGAPNVPDCFADLASDPRVFHSSHYLRDLKRQNDPRRIAVIGAGQSAAEIFLDLHGREGIQADLITRAWAFKPSDDSPFVNEIFNPEYTDYVFNNPTGQREALMEEYKSTNYSAPDLDLIQQIYDVFYQQKVTGDHRHRFRRRHEVTHAISTDDGIRLEITELDSGAIDTATYDAVVLATGYRRDMHKTLLDPLTPYLGDFAVDRHYRVFTPPHFKPAIFLQGCCEPTHGLSDTLLSILAARTQEICEALDETLPTEHSKRAATPAPSLASTN